jgi:hypothetical protein
MEKFDRVRFLVIALNTYTKLYESGKDLVIYKPTDTTGKVVAATLVEDSDYVLILGDKSSICIKASEIPSPSRASIGNVVIKNSKVLSVSKV